MKESKIEDIFEGEDKRPEVKELFKKLKKELPNLEKLFQECNSHWGYEEPVYRLLLWRRRGKNSKRKIMRDGWRLQGQF
ncbi:MAG: hypothetical protein AABY78_09520 [Nitrospirota bacterium]